MSDSIHFNPTDLKRILKKAGPELTAEPLKRFFVRSCIIVQKRGRENAPINNGRLRSSINYEIDNSSPPKFGKVGTDLFYAPYQEFGTGLLAYEGAKKPHWPPAAALDNWARKHGTTGFLVARAIGRRGGLRPKLYLTHAFEDSQPDIREELRKTGRDIYNNWNRGTG